MSTGAQVVFRSDIWLKLQCDSILKVISFSIIAPAIS
jgi:hypothetical protein